MTQAQLGARVALPQSHVSDLERGICEPKVSTAARVAAVLGLRIEDVWVVDNRNGGRAK